MTEALERVVAELDGLPARAQDKIASLLREEIDRQWDALLASPQSVRLLDRLAEEAFDDLRNGRTREFKP